MVSIVCPGRRVAAGPQSLLVLLLLLGATGCGRMPVPQTLVITTFQRASMLPLQETVAAGDLNGLPAAQAPPLALTVTPVTSLPAPEAAPQGSVLSERLASVPGTGLVAESATAPGRPAVASAVSSGSSSTSQPADTRERCCLAPAPMAQAQRHPVAAARPRSSPVASAPLKAAQTPSVRDDAAGLAALLDAAHSALHAGDHRLAYEKLQAVLARDPQHAAARQLLHDNAADLAELLHHDAMQSYRRQQLTEAIGLWDQVLELAPEHALARDYRQRAQELQARLAKIQ